MAEIRTNAENCWVSRNSNFNPASIWEGFLNLNWALFISFWQKLKFHPPFFLCLRALVAEPLWTWFVAALLHELRSNQFRQILNAFNHMGVLSGPRPVTAWGKYWHTHVIPSVKELPDLIKSEFIWLSWLMVRILLTIYFLFRWIVVKEFRKF